MVLLQLCKLNKLDSIQTTNAMKWNNVEIRLKFKRKYELEGKSQNCFRPLFCMLFGSVLILMISIIAYVNPLLIRFSKWGVTFL